MKLTLLTGLVYWLLLSLAAPACAADITALGKIQLEYTAVEGFNYTGCTYDFCPNDYLSISGSAGLTSTGTGWRIGGKFFPTGWDSEFRPLFSMYHGTVATVENESTGERVLAAGEAIGIGLEWCPWIGLFERIENGEMPDSVSAFQLFTYHLEVSYPLYRVPPGCRDNPTGRPLRVTLGVGVYFD